MNVYKRQNIQKLIIDQAGTDRLILNDLILGREGAQTLAQLIPEYHTNLMHLEVKGNNIDSQGFQMLLMALMHCPKLVTIQAEWNHIGSSPNGIMTLLYLVQNLRFIQLIDLKNNKISHHSAEMLAQIIKVNSRSLAVLDLRWNQLGEVGAQILYPALAFNGYLKSLCLQDNRISGQTLLQIAQYMKNTARGTLQANVQFANATTKTQPIQASSYFPITEDAFPSMDSQVKAGQLRNKIQNQQQQALLQQQKLQVQIQKAIQKIRVKGSQIHQSQVRYDSLSNQNVNLINSLRQSERIFGIVKQKYFGIDKNLSSDKSSMRAQKHHTNEKMQMAIQKIVQRQQRQLDDITSVMMQKQERLNAYYKDRVNDKRINRDKLAEIKQDIAKFKLSKEAIWDKVALSTSASLKNNWEEQCIALQQLIGKAETAVKAERKKSEYLGQELTNFVMRSLRKEQKNQQDIFDVQNKIKDLHKNMTLANVDIEQSQCKIALKESDIIEKEASVDLTRRYIKYIQSQTSVNVDIERLKSDEDSKADRFSQQTVEIRIADLERAVRQQQAKNKIVKNFYQKLLAQLEVVTKSTIHTVLFEQ